MKHLFCLLLALTLLAGCGPAPQEAAQAPADPGTFALTFLPIGKGDAFLLTDPAGGRWLVDTGKDEDFPQIARILRAKGVETLEGIFITHGHKDHVGSLALLTQMFRPKAIYRNARDDASFSDILPEDAAAGTGAEVRGLMGGEILDLGGAEAQVWIPAAVDYKNENNNSLILRIVHGETAFLLMGDAEFAEEDLFLRSTRNVRADVLKLGHHGEDDATSPRFLDAVKPQFALVAGNLEENPDSVHSPVADLLKTRGIACYYSEGDPVDFVSDGKTVTPQSFPDPELPNTAEIRFSQVDRKGQRVTVENPTEVPQDLTGCVIWSERGDQGFLFPAGTVLAPGQKLTVACTDAEKPGDLLWEEPGVWKKKRDAAVLYDGNLNPADRDEPETD